MLSTELGRVRRAQRRGGRVKSSCSERVRRTAMKQAVGLTASSVCAEGKTREIGTQQLLTAAARGPQVS